MLSLEEKLLSSLDCYESLDRSQRQSCAQRAESLVEATDDEVQQLLEKLLKRPPLPSGCAAESFLSTLLSHLVKRLKRTAETPRPNPPSPEMLGRITLLYKHLGSISKARFELLRMLSTVCDAPALNILAELIATDPPQELSQVALVLAPLFQRQDYDAQALFPKMLDGLAHPSVAAAILDLANFTSRNQLLSQHPATDRVEQLIHLFGGLIQRLNCLEERPEDFSDSARQIGEKISESVALAVSLCDTLALIGDRSAVGKLNQAVQLSHRRIRTEAAAALARLGEESATATLVELAAEPIARLRVLAYAEELGIVDSIDREHKTPVAMAEAELALWLAEPTQMGIAPSDLELFDQRSQYWPGYDEPVECYLFRYTYRFEGAAQSNIGVAGPLTHAFAADLGDLAAQEIYAAFAGWQAEHEDIYELDYDPADETRSGDVARLARRLQDADYQQIEPITLGLFFGDRALVASATHHGVAGLAVVDMVDIFWYPQAKSLRPPGPSEVYCIYKGRKLLRSFND